MMKQEEIKLLEEKIEKRKKELETIKTLEDLQIF